MLQNCKKYLGYSITKSGRVFTHRKRFGLGKGKGGGVKIDPNFKKELNPYLGHGGYWYVSISTKNGQRSVPIHTLLLDAFVRPMEKNEECRHLDGNRKNNKLKNLVYGSRQENANDRKRHGRSRKGEKHPLAKLTEKNVLEIRDFYKKGHGIAKISRLFNMSESGIRDIIRRKNWAHI